MTLEDLVARLPEKKIVGNPALRVRGLAYHSEKVRPGFLFAAVRGMKEDGRRFVPEALARGAVSLLVDAELDAPRAVQVVVPDVREALARLSAAFYGNPSSSLTLIGITGTNGKTTTSYLVESILKKAGMNVGVIGTVNYRYADRVLSAPTTTPESLDLQEILRSMREAGVTHVVLEVSSHSLDLQRVRGCDFDVALFTNLTRDHLDYHKSMEEYFRAKQLLFARYLQESRKERRYSVINMDDPRGEDLSRTAGGTLFRYSLKKGWEVWPERAEETPEGLQVWVTTPRGSFHLVSPLIGRHNLYNLLAAVSAAEVLGLSHRAVAEGIARMVRVPGRMERVPGSEEIGVFVDYAHTPDALGRALETLGKIRSGKLIVVFGCGGDRDAGKRSEMGRIAAQLSDLTVITSDNPRTEDPLKIIEEVERGALEAGAKKYLIPELIQGWEGPGYAVVPDRREAIGRAIGFTRRGDVVLVAGKGHEDYQIIGNQRFPFNDLEVAREALRLRGQGGEKALP